MIEDVAARYVIDADPNRIELLWRRMYSSGYAQRPDLTLVGVLCGLEMACWDIVGKAAGKPVYELLGGRVHERLRTYTYLYPARGPAPDACTTHAAQRGRRRRRCERRAGLHGRQVRPGRAVHRLRRTPCRPWPTSSARWRSPVRSATPSAPRADLLFGTHGQFTAAGAIRMAQRLEPFDPLWFEEPTPPDKPEEMAQVARQTSIPIATGERLTTINEFAARARHQAAAIIQPNLGRCGGLLDGKKIAAIAEAYGVPDRAAPLLRPDRGGGQHPARRHAAELPDPREHPGLGRLPRRTADAPDPVGGRPRDPVDRARPRRRTERSGRVGPPLPRRRRPPPRRPTPQRDR